MSQAQRRAERVHNAKVFVVVVLAILAVVSAGSWWFYFRTPGPVSATRQQIVKIELIPVPEGASATFVANPNRFQAPLTDLLAKVPISLPGPLRQGFWCHGGGLVRFTLADGRIISYGPCRLPPSIVAFRASL